MAIVSTFFVAFLFSVIGTIPPGTQSLTIVQLGLDNRINTAWRMAFAAAIVEYPYAWIAVEFHGYLNRSVEITHNFHLLSAAVMLLMGIFNLWSSARPTKFGRRFKDSGFRRGLLLGILNPLAIPFWLAVTAYLKSYGWVTLSDRIETHAYLLGVSTGTFVIFMTLAYLAQRVIRYFKEQSFIKKLPGVVLLLLGFYSLGRFIFG